MGGYTVTDDAGNVRYFDAEGNEIVETALPAPRDVDLDPGEFETRVFSSVFSSAKSVPGDTGTIASNAQTVLDAHQPPAFPASAEPTSSKPKWTDYALREAANIIHKGPVYILQRGETARLNSMLKISEAGAGVAGELIGKGMQSKSPLVRTGAQAAGTALLIGLKGGPVRGGLSLIKSFFSKPKTKTSGTGHVIAEPAQASQIPQPSQSSQTTSQAQGITGYAVLSRAGSKLRNLFGGNQPFTQTTDSRVQDAVDAFVGEGTWIYNPYKSKHYDSLCTPAILFNDRKERQILCKYLKCIDDTAKSGGPLDACEFEYELGMCLYVDSAQYKLEGKATFFKVLNNIKRAFFSNIIGLATTTGYLFVWPGCVHYQALWPPLGAMADAGKVEVGGLRATACGTAGSLLAGREMIEFAKSMFNPEKRTTAPADIPDDAQDFCAGLDYKVNV